MHEMTFQLFQWQRNIKSRYSFSPKWVVLAIHSFSHFRVIRLSQKRMNIAENLNPEIMKQGLFTFFLMLSISSALAQPSEATIRADLRKDFPNYSSVTFNSAGSTVKEWEGNKQITVYRRSVSVTSPANNPNYPGVRVVQHGGVGYNVVGGKYTFRSFNPSNEELLGMPDPNKEELQALIQSNLQEIFRLAARNRMIGEPQAFVFGNNTKFKWHSFRSVSFEMETVIESFINDIGDAEKVRQSYEIRVYRDGDTGPWNRLVASESANNRTVISTKRYTAAERENLKSFEMILQTRLADEKWATFKPLNMPEMKDAYDVMTYVHGVFMSGDKNLIENVLYHMLPSFYFEKPDFKVLTRDGADMVNKILASTVSNDFIYKNQYCEFPELKERGSGYLDYWNKNKTAYTRLEIGTEEGKWKLGSITMYVIQVPEQARQIEAAACGNGQLSAVQRGEREGVSKLKKNQMVLAYYDSDGYWYPATYLSYGNYWYDVQYSIDNSKGKVRKVVPFDPQAGDIAYVKLTDGSIVEVEIVSVSGNNAVIKAGESQATVKIAGLMFK